MIGDNTAEAPPITTASLTHGSCTSNSAHYRSLVVNMNTQHAAHGTSTCQTYVQDHLSKCFACLLAQMCHTWLCRWWVLFQAQSNNKRPHPRPKQQKYVASIQLIILSNWSSSDSAAIGHMTLLVCPKTCGQYVSCQG